MHLPHAGGDNVSAGVRILALSGSTRRASHNRALVEIAMAAAEKAGVKGELLDLRDFHLPLYDADHEAAHGLPGAALTLKALFEAADGYLIASPEYNGSLSAVLKNAIDWLSRPMPNTEETPFTLRAFRGKVAGIMSASPGAWGGIRALMHLRQVLSGMGTLVVAEQLAVPSAPSAFDASRALANPFQQAGIEAIGTRVAQLAKAMRIEE
jgi:NAD(P)H-dependent FMN reductase